VRPVYAFGPAVRLGLDGAARARGHFDREYGPAATGENADVEARVRFMLRPPTGAGAGGHKTARWRVTLSDPEDRPLRAGIQIGGGPPSFALSLVQGYYVEPLVGVALARAGFVALPSAAVAGGGGALVIMGRSRSGKSSVSVRQLAAGCALLGDDQIVIGPDGGCWAYPRRLRVYPDICDTAPEAWPRLRPATRRTLLAREAVRRVTRGYVAPSLAVPATEIGPPAPRGRHPAVGLLVVTRGESGALTESRRDAAWAAAQARGLLAAQRERLSALAGPRWSAALSDAVACEGAVLSGWLETVDITELTIPRDWDARTSVGALAARVADRLGVISGAAP
jgi:hypothetical protein